MTMEELVMYGKSLKNENVFSFDEYRKKTSFFNSYPENEKVLCACLGLFSEAGEIAGKFDKAIRDNNKQINEKNKSDIVKEIGDAFWYLSELANLKNISFCIHGDVTVNDESVFINALNLRKSVTHLIDSVMEFNGKFIQADFFEKVFFDLSQICYQIGVSANYVLNCNLEKLTDRYNRNKIHGAGDNR